MGARNVAAVVAVWAPRVPDPAYRLLIHMALVARDEDDPPTFFGGPRRG